MRGCLNLRLAGLSAVLLLTLATSAFAQSTGGSDLAMNQTVSTNCGSGEAVALGGNLHFTYSASSDPASGANQYQVTVASNSSGTGQSSQGNYAGSASFAYSFSTTDSPAQLTPLLRYRINSQGSAPSLMLNLSLAISLDNTGNFSASVGSASTECVQ
jgi:hypothetical protein